MTKIVLTVAVVAIAGGLLRWVWTHQIDPKATVEGLVRGAIEPDWIATRDTTKLYQEGHPVADIVGDVKQSADRVLFGRLVNVQGLDGQKTIEYGRLKLRVRRIATVTGALSTGRELLHNVWDGVDCEIVSQ